MSLLLTGIGVDNQPSGGSPISFVQGANIAGTSATSESLAFTSANTAGNLIIAVLTITASTGAPTFSDTRGNTYTVVSYFVGAAKIALAYAKNIAGGANTVTATWPGAATGRMAIHEYAGASVTAPLDTFVTATGTTVPGGSTDNVSVSLTTAANAELLFCWASVATPVTAGTGFTLREAPNAFNLSEDKAAGGAGSQSITCSEGPSSTYTVIAAAFNS